MNMRKLSLILLSLLLFVHTAAGSTTRVVAYHKNIPNIYIDENISEVIKDRKIVVNLVMASFWRGRACLKIADGGTFLLSARERTQRAARREGAQMCFKIDPDNLEEGYAELLKSFIVVYNRMHRRQFNALHDIVIAEIEVSGGRQPGRMRLIGTLIEFGQKE